MLLLQCQGLLDEYTQLRQSLQDQIQSKDKSFSDLEDLESWLRGVYTLLCLEPSKLWTSASALSPWHQPQHESTDAPQGGSLYEPPLPPLALSQPSDYSLFVDTDVSPAVLDRSYTVSAKSLTFVHLKHSLDCEVEKFGSYMYSDSGQISHDLEAVLNKLEVSVTVVMGMG